VYQQEILDPAAQLYEEWLGKIVDERFRIIDVLGIGGYSVVYKAQDIETPRAVALKMIHQHLATQSEAVARFQREISTSRGLDHPNIARIFHAGATDKGQLYLAMEFLSGVTLSEEIATRGKLSPPRAVSVTKQVCAGLHHAHMQGIVHRDVKPANVFLTQGDVAKILDFGLVKVMDKTKRAATLTQTGATIGTPCYMSPEQCHGYDLDARSDVYALGCMLYEMLCGDRVFDNESYVVLMQKHVSERPNYVPLEASGVPKPVISVIDRALQKDRNNRWRSAADLAQALVAATEQKQGVLGSLFRPAH
jgi:serine/threonine-protein kinase